jgi:hypothetical protein
MSHDFSTRLAFVLGLFSNSCSASGSIENDWPSNQQSSSSFPLRPAGSSSSILNSTRNRSPISRPDCLIVLVVDKDGVVQHNGTPGSNVRLQPCPYGIDTAAFGYPSLAYARRCSVRANRRHLKMKEAAN